MCARLFGADCVDRLNVADGMCVDSAGVCVYCSYTKYSAMNLTIVENGFTLLVIFRIRKENLQKERRSGPHTNRTHLVKRGGVK